LHWRDKSRFGWNKTNTFRIPTAALVGGEKTRKIYGLVNGFGCNENNGLHRSGISYFIRCAAHVRAQKVQTWRYSAAVEPRTFENFA
jgi:hypothetical protein